MDALAANKSSAQEVPKGFLFDLRALFYLVRPSETYYEKSDDVPDITLDVAHLFFTFIVIEQIIAIIKNGQFTGRINDTVTSVSAGFISSLPNFLTRKFHFLAYAWVYDNYKYYEIPWDSFWTYLITFLFVDMMYYWFHRAAHEVNVFWAAHQAHHSSEDYNFSTALRQSIFQGYTSWFFYLPLAFFVRPSIYMVHSHLNLVYQFWIHTEIVDSIGPLEYILNTPSHHRVHHGRNPYCLDKNYAGVLIIWDRLFGTFEAEKKDEKIAYGLVHPLKTFDPTHIQIFNYKYIIKKCWNAKTWEQRFGIVFKGPAWLPGTPRLGNPETAPKIKYPIKKYDARILDYLSVYVLIHFLFISIIFAEFSKKVDEYPTLILSLAIFYTMFNLTCFGWIFDAKPKCLFYEGIRCVSFILLSIYYSDHLRSFLFDSELFYTIFWWFNLASFVFVFGLWSSGVSIKKEPLAAAPPVKPPVNKAD